MRWKPGREGWSISNVGVFCCKIRKNEWNIHIGDYRLVGGSCADFEHGTEKIFAFLETQLEAIEKELK